MNNDITEEFSIANMAPVVPVTGGEEGIISKNKNDIENLMDNDNAEIIDLPDNTKFNNEIIDIHEYSFDDLDRVANMNESATAAYFIGYFATVGLVSAVTSTKLSIDYGKIRKAIKLYEDNNKLPFKSTELKYQQFSMKPFKDKIETTKKLNMVSALMKKITYNSVCTMAVLKGEDGKERPIFRFYNNANNKNANNLYVEIIDSEMQKHKDYCYALVSLKTGKELGNIRVWADDIIEKYREKTKSDIVNKNINEAYNSLSFDSKNSMTEEDVNDSSIIFSEKVINEMNTIKQKKDRLYKKMYESLLNGNNIDTLMTEYTNLLSTERDFFVEATKGKQQKNDKGEIVPDVCPKCGSKIGIFSKGEPVYLCTNKDCKKFFGVVPVPKSLLKENTLDIYSFEKVEDIDWYSNDDDLVKESKNIADDMVDIIKTLNEKGYKTKYSSPGYPSERIKKDMYRDGIYKDKLYTTARVVFAKIYEFKEIPKHWRSEILDGDKIALYVINPTYKITDGVPKDAFYKWKAKYMYNLKSWADSLPKYGEEDKKDDVKLVESSDEVLNDLMSKLYVESL